MCYFTKALRINTKNKKRQLFSERKFQIYPETGNTPEWNRKPDKRQTMGIKKLESTLLLSIFAQI